jgi:ABC-type Mn2+/Zn2+ transport system permease subunit
MLSAASILAPVSGDFGTATAAELILVGASCGAVGVWVVQFGRAFLAESFTHALLPGLVLAAILGMSLLVGAVLGVVLAYGVTLLISRVPRSSTSSGTSVTVTLLVAGGALLASQGSARGESAVPFENLLFGNPLAASSHDIELAVVLAAAIGVTMYLLQDRFTALAFDRESARTLGVNVGLTSAALLGLLVFSIAVAANVAGSLLSLALVTGPAIGALAVSQRIGRAIALAATLGAVCGVAGIYLSYYADWPASASIALFACAAAIAPNAVRAAVRFRRPAREATA